MPNSPAQYSWPGGYQWPQPQFPPSIVPALWFDGNQQAFSDAAGTLPASSGLIRRINEAAVPGGTWLSASDNERPLRDSNAVRFEPVGTAGGYEMTRTAAAGVTQNACTIVASFVYRDGAVGSPGMGIMRCDDQSIGIFASSVLWVYYGAAQIWFTTIPILQGVKNTVTVRYTPTGIDASVTANGVTTTQSFATVLPGTAVSAAWRIGFISPNYFYGSITQCMVTGRALSDAEITASISWANSRVADLAYPNERSLITYVGDSITRGVAATYGLSYPFLSLTSIRGTKPLTEVSNTATPGYGVTGILNNTSPGGPGTTYYEAKRFYAAARLKNVMLIHLGTNDLANGNSVAYLLNGTGAIAGSGLYPLCDDARARGFKVVLSTILPRSGSLSVPQATFDANRDAANIDIAANWPLHADGFWDVRGIAGMGANGDSAGANYADGVHPNNAGHALLAPTAAAAVLALL